MGDRAFELIDRMRRRLARDGAGTRVLEPLAKMLTIERGLTRATWTFVARRGLTVGAGPFAGTRYPRSSAVHVPGLAGRLAGSYEAELHPALERLIAREPELVVNIGAGDGLYAVGMALCCPRASVIAYELDPYAARVCGELARANGLESRLQVLGGCTVDGLSAVEAPPGTVVICDCEGAEGELIDPARVAWLKQAALLIEIHESYRPELGALLRERLAATHSLESIEGARRYLEDYPMLWDLPGLSPVQIEGLMTELRPWRTSWLLALPG